MHLDTIHKEMKKGQPDIRLIADKLKRTSVYRHRLCAESQASAEVLEQLPCLRLQLFVSAIH